MHNRPEIFLPAYFPVSGINKIPIYLRTLSDRTGKWGMGEWKGSRCYTPVQENVQSKREHFFEHTNG